MPKENVFQFSEPVKATATNMKEPLLL